MPQLCYSRQLNAIIIYSEILSVNTLSLYRLRTQTYGLQNGAGSEKISWYLMTANRVRAPMSQIMRGGSIKAEEFTIMRKGD